MDAEIVYVDPRLIVNIRGIRPVTAFHVNYLKEGFRKNGYIPSNLITCRIPTARELAEFYKKQPQGLTDSEAEGRAQDILKRPLAGGHFYCVDGLHRRKLALELMETKEYREDFRLVGSLVKDLCTEQEIALSIFLNSSNEYSIKLSACALVLQCHRYDEIVNSGRKKMLSAAEVRRRMVQCGGFDKRLSEKTASSMAETRRQVIGISRKLPVSALRYLESVQETNPEGAESAFTISNLKNVPKKLTNEEAVALMHRAHNYYKTQIPIPRAMSPGLISESCVYIRRAIKAINTFQELCGFARLPQELVYLASQMKNTSTHDEALSHCSYDNDELYDALARECENKIPGGSAKVMTARKKISQKRGIPTEETESANLENCTSSVKTREMEIDTNEEECSGVHLSPSAPQFEILNLKSDVTYKSQKSKICEHHEGKTKRTLFPISHPHSLQPNRMPPGWVLLNCSFKDFAMKEEEWTHVETCADFVIFDIPGEEHNQDNIDALIRHVGNALCVTGVAHAFCKISQFSRIAESASRIGLTVINTPLLYISDVTQTKKLTFSLQPQGISEYAAVFYKSSNKRNEKHHYYAKHTYEQSITPAWTNVTTNVCPSKNRLTDEKGKLFDPSERSKELYKFILRQWCRPGGICYNPMAGAMSVGLAAYDIGIKYVGIESEESFFSAARSRLQSAFSLPIKRKVAGNVNQSTLSRAKEIKSSSSDETDEDDKAPDDLSPNTNSGSSKNNITFKTKDANDHARIQKALRMYPDRQEETFRSDSSESEIRNTVDFRSAENASGCSAGLECIFATSSLPPVHRCGVCMLPVHNLCDYGKRVMKEFDREMIYACSKKCYEGERSSR